jgi:MoxR-like ATPase
LNVVNGTPDNWGRLTEVINRFNTVGRRLDGRYVGRNRAIRLLQVAVLCREHVLLLGPPGTAKTDLVDRFADLIAARKFAYLLTRFTEPSELFGPLDFEAFRNSNYQVRTDNMLPDAQVAFLDEVFQGSSAILNTLLTLINERIFHNGATPMRAPLITVIGAANEMPDDPVLRAFADRFLLRAQLAPVAETQLHDLLALGWDRERDALSRQIPENITELATWMTPAKERHLVELEDLAGLSRCVSDVDLELVLPDYEEVVRELLAARVMLSDRRVVRGQKLIAAAAVLRNSTRAAPKDLWPLTHFWADHADAPIFEEIVQARVEADGGEQLHSVRTARQIVTDARYEYQQAQRRVDDGGLVPSILSRALGRLNEFRLELLQAHGAGQDAIAIEEMIDSLIGALESTY